MVVDDILSAQYFLISSRSMKYQHFLQGEILYLTKPEEVELELKLDLQNENKYNYNPSYTYFDQRWSYTL